MHAVTVRDCTRRSCALGLCNTVTCNLFCTGAFVPGVPVLPVVLQYRWRRLNPAWTIINEGFHMVHLLDPIDIHDKNLGLIDKGVVRGWFCMLCARVSALPGHWGRNYGQLESQSNDQYIALCTCHMVHMGDHPDPIHPSSSSQLLMT